MIQMVPGNQIPNLTEDQLLELGFFDSIKSTVAAGGTQGGMADLAKFAASIADSIPEKKIISFNITTVANVNLFRDPTDVYLPKNRFRKTVMEAYVSPSTLQVQIGFFVMPLLVEYIGTGTAYPHGYRTKPSLAKGFGPVSPPPCDTQSSMSQLCE